MGDLGAHVTDGLMRLNRNGEIPGPGLVEAARELLKRAPESGLAEKEDDTNTKHNTKVMRISLWTNGPGHNTTVRVYVHDYNTGEESQLIIREGDPLPESFSCLTNATSRELLDDVMRRLLEEALARQSVDVLGEDR
jgi:hypothetical protein